MYVMNKNQKPLSLKVPDKAERILEKYKANKKQNNGYVFPFLANANQKDPKDIFMKSRNASRLFNKYLKRIAKRCEIDKNLSNHIARHSFGNIAGDKIHPLMLQKLYRHSDLKTTVNYQANFIHKEADDALDTVINF
ncbi:MAG: tyrosine-type recombinase/integrase [Flavobacteriaceae bacterium]|nr:MAG: tyrosine-type recombinase/integrase [Flavobacteriaceae bacterium]